MNSALVGLNKRPWSYSRGVQPRLMSPFQGYTTTAKYSLQCADHPRLLSPNLYTAQSYNMKVFIINTPVQNLWIYHSITTAPQRTSLCSASFVGCQRDAASICCWAKHGVTALAALDRYILGLMEFARVDKSARSKRGRVENAGVDISARCGKSGQCGK